MLDEDTELDIIFAAIDDLYWEAVNAPEKRKKIDLILSQVKEDYSTAVLIGFLSITLPHKEEFQENRNRIAEMVRRKEPDRWERLLIGLI